MEDKIIKILEESGVSFKEKSKTIYTECPRCHREDKFSILKANGSTVCYRGSCDWGVQPFTNWVSEILSISLIEAKNKVYQTDYYKEYKFEINNKTEKYAWNPFESDIKEIEYPENSHELTGVENEGTAYMRNRGLSADICSKFKIKYNSAMRRIIFPVFYENKLVGYQARAIDKVSDKFKVRNNEGFRRDSLVMFLDNVKPNEFVIIAEGPVDAMKFNQIGNFVATMGKIVSDKQIDLIKRKNPQKVYLALDADAAKEMSELARSFDVPTYLLTVPESCKKRCLDLGKKPDFGECTFDEAVIAFNNPETLGYYNLILNWETK